MSNEEDPILMILTFISAMYLMIGVIMMIDYNFVFGRLVLVFGLVHTVATLIGVISDGTRARNTSY